MVCPVGRRALSLAVCCSVPSVKFLTVAVAETFQLPRGEFGKVRLTTFFLHMPPFCRLVKTFIFRQSLTDDRKQKYELHHFEL